jgi:imidazolonepropionase
MWDTIWINGNLATMTEGAPYGAIEDGAVATSAGVLTWVGARRDLPVAPAALADEVVDVSGAWITPGLIDCHTHLVYGGERSAELELRLEGASYEEIARAGGGIVSTVAATRAASIEELLATASARLDDLLAEGITTIEIKSGYGLDTATELKMLEVARALGERWPVTVRTTFLGAHALPQEYTDRADAYIDLICDEMLPAVAEAGLADAVDGFCERIAFSADQMARVFDAAQRLGLPVKLHAEQLSDQGGCQLVAANNGLSADHLEYVSEAGVQALAGSGTVAVLLPGAFYVLRETQLPPIDLLRKHRVPIAVSTDCNPGTSPVTSILLTLNMACTLFRLTPAEALAGVTRNAARALGMEATHGTLEPGKTADMVIWDIPRPAYLAYTIGANPCRSVIRGGRTVRHRARAAE